MADETLTLERALRLFTYDPDSGRLFWKHRPESDFVRPGTCRAFNTRSAGREVGKRMQGGYIRFRLGKKGYQVHRVIWLIAYGEWPDQVDHIDGNPSNNRLSNLREVNALLNARNAARRNDNTSGVTGVSRASKANRWVASIGVGEGVVHLGQYRTLEEAVAARRAAEKVLQYHPNHGRT